MEMKIVKQMTKYMSRVKSLLLLVILTVLLPLFQNCSKQGLKVTNLSESIGITSSANPEQNAIEAPPVDTPSSNPVITPPSGALQVCQGISCTLSPITTKVAVTTILLALGDEANDLLVINGTSSQLIAETVIRYTSPILNPKILVVRDSQIDGEDPEDTIYVSEVLLSRYQTKMIIENANGLSMKDTEGYDLIWFNNPGHSMSSTQTYQTLKAFKGGVVIQGDDLSQGAGFSIQDLTKLKYINNGGSIACSGSTFTIDNNSGNQYEVSLDKKKFPFAIDQNNLKFNYGNDIDHTVVLSNDVEVLAQAKGADDSCSNYIPVIVRYFK